MCLSLSACSMPIIHYSLHALKHTLHPLLPCPVTLHTQPLFLLTFPLTTSGRCFRWSPAFPTTAALTRAGTQWPHDDATAISVGRSDGDVQDGPRCVPGRPDGQFADLGHSAGLHSPYTLYLKPLSPAWPCRHPTRSRDGSRAHADFKPRLGWRERRRLGEQVLTTWH